MKQNWKGTVDDAYKCLARAILDRSYQDVRNWPPTGQSHLSSKDRYEAQKFLDGGGTFDIVRGLAEL